MSRDSAPVREMFINFAVVPHAAIICYWWVRVSFGVRIRVDVRVSKLIGVRISLVMVRVKLRLGLVL